MRTWSYITVYPIAYRRIRERFSLLERDSARHVGTSLRMGLGEKRIIFFSAHGQESRFRIDHWYLEKIAALGMTLKYY